MFVMDMLTFGNCIISPFLLYTSPFLNINIFKFLLRQIGKGGSQWSKDGNSLEEYKCSPSVKSKVIEMVEGDKKKETTVNEYVYKSVDIVSNLIEPPRDKDGKIQYQCMSLNTGIYENGNNLSTARRQKNSLHYNELCPCHVNGCNFGGFAKWLGDDKKISITTDVK